MKFKTQSKLIREARMRAGLSQRTLADKLHISAQVISNTERGLAGFPTSRLKLLSSTLKINSKALLYAVADDYIRTVKSKAGL